MGFPECGGPSDGSPPNVLRRATEDVDGNQEASSSTTPVNTAMQSIYEIDIKQDGVHLTENFRCFMASRVDTPDSQEYLKKRRARKGKPMSKKRKEEAGKLFRFKRESPEVQKGLLQSRREEWKKWQHFNSTQVVSRQEADKLIQQGF